MSRFKENRRQPLGRRDVLTLTFSTFHTRSWLVIRSGCHDFFLRDDGTKREGQQ